MTKAIHAMIAGQCDEVNSTSSDKAVWIVHLVLSLVHYVCCSSLSLSLCEVFGLAVKVFGLIDTDLNLL